MNSAQLHAFEKILAANEGNFDYNFDEENGTVVYEFSAGDRVTLVAQIGDSCQMDLFRYNSNGIGVASVETLPCTIATVLKWAKFD